MFPRRERNAPALVRHVGQECDHLGVVRRQRVPLQRVTKAPVHHLEERDDLPDLFLELRVGLGVGIRGVRVALVAACDRFLPPSRPGPAPAPALPTPWTHPLRP